MVDRRRFGYRDYSLAPDLRLFYGEGSDQVLTPYQQITNPSLSIGIVNNNCLKPKYFLLRHTDMQPIRLIESQTGRIYEVKQPGKSAFLYFGDSPYREKLAAIVEENLQQLLDRRDHLHLATVGNIEQAGWEVWWTPLPERNNWLHVRLIPQSIVQSGRKPTLEEVTALQKVFIKGC